MKKTYLLLLAIAGMVITGCSVETVGPVGPPGPPGFDGLDGEEAFVFEYEIDFRPPDYTTFVEFPNDFEMLESDVALVYLLWEVDENGTEVWRAIPSTLFLDEGALQYNFDFTRFDVALFMDAQFPLDILGPTFTDDWIVRVVVVPGQFGFNGRTLSPVDYNSYEEVVSYYNLSTNDLNISSYTRFQ